MPFQFLININKASGSHAKFDPPVTNNIAPGDQIVWANNDTQAHWPGLKNADGTIDQTFFMANQIAPNSSSTTFSPGSKGTLNYVCSLHPTETGTIEVNADQ